MTSYTPGEMSVADISLVDGMEVACFDSWCESRCRIRVAMPGGEYAATATDRVDADGEPVGHLDLVAVGATPVSVGRVIAEGGESNRNHPLFLLDGASGTRAVIALTPRYLYVRPLLDADGREVGLRLDGAYPEG